jgi:excinuclease ABC subunit B
MFKIASQFAPTGDQPQAIKKLTSGLKKGMKHQTLLGVTGSGKTFTIANVIANHKKPVLVISHNKTLAAQLYQEFKDFFPNNAVHYFVSYYDYYQPEAYIPYTNTYIEKDSRINEEIDRLRHSATQALLTRDDVIIVASVSCIYNLGSPEEYKKLSFNLFEGQKIQLKEIVAMLRRLQYEAGLELKRGTFRTTSDELEVVSATGDNIIKIKMKGNTIAKIMQSTDIDLETLFYTDVEYHRILETQIFPAKYWLASDEHIDVAIKNIKAEMQQHVKKLVEDGYVLEAERLKSRTEHDMKMLQQTGFCHGIENYSRQLEFRAAGDPPYTLIDYFREKGEFLTIIDESHLTIPQVRGMYNGDNSRKSTLVEHGFRLPSALDNRPLKFEEFNEKIQDVVYISATPNNYELELSDQIVEQLVRPTGLLDPIVEIHPVKDQIPHLIGEIKKQIEKKQRVIVTTLTKRMAEDLTDYLHDEGVKVNYIHSEIKTLQRLEIIHDLRLGNYDVIVGVNLLREGLDLPEVSLVAILDADKEGFLRNATTLIQTMGRAARHVQGRVIMYADKITKSMKQALQETDRRRKKQEAHNTKHGIEPQTIVKSLKRTDLHSSSSSNKTKIGKWYSYSPADKEADERLTPNQRIQRLQKEMDQAVKKLKFERAIALREEILRLKREIQGK